MIRLKSDPQNNVVFVKIEGSALRHRHALKSAMYDIGQELKRTAAGRINRYEAKTGRFYPYKGIMLRASAANENPTRRSGKLKRSIDYTVRGVTQVEFGSRINYGKFLEEGTRNMARRNYLQRVADDKAMDFVRMLNSATMRSLRK